MADSVPRAKSDRSAFTSASLLGNATARGVSCKVGLLRWLSRWQSRRPELARQAADLSGQQGLAGDIEEGTPRKMSAPNVGDWQLSLPVDVSGTTRAAGGGAISSISAGSGDNPASAGQMLQHLRHQVG